MLVGRDRFSGRALSHPSTHSLAADTDPLRGTLTSFALVSTRHCFLNRRVAVEVIPEKQADQRYAGPVGAPPLCALRSPVWWLPLGLLAIFYLRFFAWLQVEWGLNVNYAFGYLIPFGAALLVYLRFDRWRAPQAPAFGLRYPVFAAVLAIGCLPLALVAEVNPDWRLLMCMEGSLLVLLSGWIVFSLGGWPWVRASLPVFAFLALAIPWPMRLEQWLLSLLLRFVSSRAADCFFLLGHDVVQHGNLLYVDGVPLGIDEACSGVQSLQLTLVIVAFLCLWRPLSPIRTLGLVVGGLSACLLGNMMRIVALGTIGVHFGNPALEQWHDAIGATATALIVCGILGVRWLVEPVGSGAAPSSRLQDFQASQALARRRISGWKPVWALPLAVALVLPSIVVPLYYGMDSGSGEARYQVAFDWGPGLPGFEPRPIPESVSEQLRYSEAEHFVMGEAGWSLQGYSFLWENGRISAFTAVHRPENCLPSIGYHMVARLRPLAMRVGDVVLPIHRYLFEMQGREFFVYHAFWDLRGGADALASASPGDRLQPVFARQSFGPRQAILFMVAGDLQAEQANRLVVEVLRRARTN